MFSTCSELTACAPIPDSRIAQFMQPCSYLDPADQRRTKYSIPKKKTNKISWRRRSEWSQTWNLSKILHRRIFRLKILHRQFHLISTVLVRKNTKNEWKWRNLHRWQKFYTATGSDGSDKFHLCPGPPKSASWFKLLLLIHLSTWCFAHKGFFRCMWEKNFRNLEWYLWWDFGGEIFYKVLTSVLWCWKWKESFHIEVLF